MTQHALPQPRIPSATYRLQFNAQFTFDQAREIVGYLHELGISDLYASSYLQAKPGSIHGYDVVNQTLLNREVGDETSYQALMDELTRHGMGHILDFVPNHMCVESEENLWWMDVLENGPSSLNAHFFDIDWAPVKKELTDKVLLPFLGDQYGRVLERGELKLSYREGAFSIDYYGMHIPIEPKSTLEVLSLNQERLQEQFSGDAPPLLEYFSIVTSLQHLPVSTERDLDLKEERHREKEIIKKRLDRLCREEPKVVRHLEESIAVFNGTVGDRHSFDLLDRLLQDQCYRLSFWRVATEEINYRRFFDINALAAIRMEDPAVFNQTHQLLFRLIREGKVTGVRIDHVDGLYDPLGYLEKLQESCFKELAGAEADYRRTVELDPGYRPFYLAVEKILMKGEQLPKEWPVFGSTGYDFLNQVNGIFVDTEQGKAFERLYDHFLGYHSDFTELMYEKKKLVLQVSLSGEANMLGHRLNTISERDRLTRDFTLNSLVRAISEVIACFPVYRTYVIPGTVRERDVQYIEAAVAKAQRKNPAMNASIFEFLRDVLLLRFPETADETDRTAWLDFAMHFQQITGPVMAKGLEDTTFYVYNRLASLNEVGGMPGRFGTTLEAFHGQSMERLKNSPHAMIATATHDTKRGEDVRTRIDALSEIPEEWGEALKRWSRLNRDKEIQVEGMRVPTHHKEYLLYQTLLGAWPLGELDPQQYETFLGRIREYIIKASREAKTNTSWISPNQPYEEALLRFVDAILARGGPNEFLDDFIPFQKRIARFGLFNSLSQVLLKMASPGCPDFYQGTELWDLTLVDPDNRRPVDYQVRLKALAGLKARERDLGPRELVRQLVESRENGWIKLYTIYRVLNFRKGNRDTFEYGDYLPLEAQGARSGNVCAFLRRSASKTLLAAVPRMLASLAPEPGQLPLGEVWLDSLLLLDGAAGRYRNVITDEELETVEHAGRTALPLARLFATAPVALLEKR
ncbi:maltooligosyl trehalose synthase [Geomonas limicola]|uniref:Maltooligosyl trehalose synthase n=1 Tax=Geomonas limicola TaxID=2740186 RepID=A0A6V8N5J7_9BACT|nr:malto-oligosyltrehalose synthase [Geomonas limicola]GFO67660.1 maltooligosyl trehalose synthase [Geomonas limicola]